MILETDGGEAVKARYVLGVNYVGRVDADDHVSYMLYNGHSDVVQTIAASSGAVECNYDYDIFGTPTLTVEGYNCPIRYAGEYYDSETGEYYLRARYYDSFTGRFTTEDTYSGESENPLSENLYAYCENDPIQYTDPTGHAPSPNDIAISHGYKGSSIAGNGNAAFAEACAQSLAAAINSKNSGSGTTVTAWQVYNTVTSSDPTSIYYATNGGTSAARESAINEIVSKPIPPDPSIEAAKKDVPKIDQKVVVEPIVTAYSLYDNASYRVRKSDVGKSAGKLLLNSTPDQTERALLALQLLGVDINKGYGADWNTPAYVLKAVKNGLILNVNSQRLENHSMQVILDALGFQASADWSMDNTFGSYMIGAVRAIMAMNGQGWQGNEGGPDSNIGPNVGASIEKMLLGLVYAKDISSVRAMYNAEQQWQVAKYEGWEQQALEQARLEAEAAKVNVALSNNTNANGGNKPSWYGDLLTVNDFRYLFNECNYSGRLK